VDGARKGTYPERVSDLGPDTSPVDNIPRIHPIPHRGRGRQHPSSRSRMCDNSERRLRRNSEGVCAGGEGRAVRWCGGDGRCRCECKEQQGEDEPHESSSGVYHDGPAVLLTYQAAGHASWSDYIRYADATPGGCTARIGEWAGDAVAQPWRMRVSEMLFAS
jgi:hypothetical protein